MLDQRGDVLCEWTVSSHIICNSTSHGFDSEIWKLIKWWWRDVGSWVRTSYYRFLFQQGFQFKMHCHIFDLKNNDETCRPWGTSHSHSCKLFNLEIIFVQLNCWVRWRTMSGLGGAHFKVKATVERRNNVRAVYAPSPAIWAFEFDFKRSLK